MAISKPFRRNCRQFIDKTYSHSGQSRYIQDPRYAKEPEQYIRAFLLIQKDLQELFDYIHQADENLKTYSFRIHQLFMRACIEIEANFKAILNENGYKKINKKTGDIAELNMNDYSKLEITHRLSSYKVKIPYWRGIECIRTPFHQWSNPVKSNPSWYNAYHETKHNRHVGFEHANFENLIDGVCGLIALLSSQFYTHDFSPAGAALGISGYEPNDGMEPAIGNYFRVQFPDFPEDERYNFTYQDIINSKTDNSFFQLIDYTEIK